MFLWIERRFTHVVIKGGHDTDVIKGYVQGVCAPHGVIGVRVLAMHFLI